MEAKTIVEPVKLIILDTLKGLALLGICLANFPEFSLYTFQSSQSTMPTARIDTVVKYLQHIFIDRKTGISRLFLFLCSFISFAATGQSTYHAVQVNVNLIPPYSLYLDDYTTGTRDRIMVTLINKDVQYPGMPVRLKLTVKANGFTLKTNDYAPIAPLLLEPNMPYKLSREEIAAYFNPNNLTPSGMGTSAWKKDRKLPEGMIEFCFEAFEHNTNAKLSLPACGMAWVSAQKPPQLSLPFNEETVQYRDPLNLLFQWTPQHMGIGNVEYEFILKQLWDNGLKPEAAWAYSTEIVREPVKTTSLLYGVVMPPLTPGMRYAWAVRAVAKEGMDEVRVFENNGLSEIRSFMLADYCPLPVSVSAKIDRGRISLEWTPLPEHLDFTVSYRQQGVEGAEWFYTKTTVPQLILYDVRPGYTYEYRIGSSCKPGNPVYGDTYTIALPTADTTANCGDMGTIELGNTEPLPSLAPGEMFMSADFPVYVTNVTGTNGVFTGDGYTIMPSMFANAKLKVKWNNITINTDRRMIKGWVEGVYDESKSQIANVGKTKQKDTIKAGIVVDFIMPPLDSTFTVKVNSSENGYLLTFTDEEGNEHTVNTDSFPVVIQDALGNVYVLDKNKSSGEAVIQDASSISSSTTILKTFPCFVGWAYNYRDSKIYFCNSQNVEHPDSVLKMFGRSTITSLNVLGVETGCNIAVEGNITIRWYNAENTTTMSRKKPASTVFSLRLNGTEVPSDQTNIHDSLLVNPENTCELLMKHNNKTTVIASYILTRYVPPPPVEYKMKVERRVEPNNTNHVQNYSSREEIGVGQSEQLLKIDSLVRFTVVSITNDTEISPHSTDETVWYVNNERQNTGTVFRHRIRANDTIVTAIGADTLSVRLRVEAPRIIDGRIILDSLSLRGLSHNRQNEIRRWFNNSVPRCNTGDLRNFLNSTDKSIIVRIENNAPDAKGSITQGQANDEAALSRDKYNLLQLRDTVYEEGIIRDAKLMSPLNETNRQEIISAVYSGSVSPNVETLLQRIARVSQSKSDSLRSMIIERIQPSDSFLSTVEYELRSGDNVSEWITFHNERQIGIMINIYGIDEENFRRLMAHELLHHWWSHFKKFEKLKWKVIRDRIPVEKLADGLSTNRGCSAGVGHERYNPEHEKVCNNQSNY